MKWTSVCRTVYLAVVDACECRSVRILVLLMIRSIAMQYYCQGPVVSLYLPISLRVVYRGEHISNLEQLTYTLEEFKGKLFSVVWEYRLWRSILLNPVSQNCLGDTHRAGAPQLYHLDHIVNRSAITMVYWKPSWLLKSALMVSIATDSSVSNAGTSIRWWACLHKRTRFLAHCTQSRSAEVILAAICNHW